MGGGHSGAAAAVLVVVVMVRGGTWHGGGCAVIDCGAALLVECQVVLHDRGTHSCATTGIDRRVA